jgi:phospholipid-translocating ATPase
VTDDKEPWRVPLNLNCLLLRECILRNTSWVVGLVLFTGDDTKIRLNTGATPSKRSRIEKQMDPYVYVHFDIYITKA